jgi:hypothetical protein
MKSKQSFKFEHEIKKTKETKIPKSKVKFKRLQPKAVGLTKETQTGTGDSGFTLGEAPANTYAPSTYSPLVQQLPDLVSPSSVDSSLASSVYFMSSEQEMYDEPEQRVFASNPIVSTSISSNSSLPTRMYPSPGTWTPVDIPYENPEDSTLTRDFPQVPTATPITLEDFPQLPELSPRIIHLLNTTPPTSNPESMVELRKAFPPSSTPAALEALANAPTVPEKIIQLRNLLNGWVYYSEKQKRALEYYVYKEALRSNNIAREKSLRAAIENRLKTFKRTASSPIDNIRQGNLPIPSLRARRGVPPLPQINTNLPIGRGPRAPRTVTVRQPDTSQITAANIVAGSRRSR